MACDKCKAKAKPPEEIGTGAAFGSGAPLRQLWVVAVSNEATPPPGLATWAYFPGGQNAKLHLNGTVTTRRVLGFKNGGQTGLLVRLGKIVKAFGSGGWGKSGRQVRVGTGAKVSTTESFQMRGSAGTGAKNQGSGYFHGGGVRPSYPAGTRGHAAAMGTGATSSIQVDFAAGVAYVVNHKAYAELETVGTSYYLKAKGGAIWASSCGLAQTNLGSMTALDGQSYDLCIAPGYVTKSPQRSRHLGKRW